jgi:glycosyltransferase involved in cell wall biosynthesis
MPSAGSDERPAGPGPARSEPQASEVGQARLRVLVLNERDPRHPQAGGAEFHVAEIFGRLAASGMRVVQLACGFRGAAAREVVAGLDVHRLGRLPLYYPRAALACARETRAGRFDVVVECLNKAPFFAPLYARAPVLALCHHLFGETAFEQVPWPVAAAVWSAERLVPRAYRRVPFVTISESSRADLAARGIDPARIRMIHPGIRRPEAAPLAWEERPCRVTYVGRIEPYKRVDVMLRAGARLLPRFPDLELFVIGRGTARPALEALARELGIADRVRFTGFVSDPERDALLAGTRVCVFPSLKEGFGLTVLEANAVGTPVVASDAPGLRDSVRDGETGLLAPAGSVTRFAERIGALLADDALARRLGEAARDFSKRFEWDDAAARMGEALEAAARP